MMPTYRDANGNEIVYVRKKPTVDVPAYGPPSPCLANMLHYAIGNGYEECAAPGEAEQTVITVAPDPVAGEEVIEPEAPTSTDNSAAIVGPVEAEETDEKPSR